MELTTFKKIPPGIEQFVETFFNDDINQFIRKKMEPGSDPKSFMLFVNVYFALHLQLPDTPDKKELIKKYLTDVILDPEQLHNLTLKFNDWFTNRTIKN